MKLTKLAKRTRIRMRVRKNVFGTAQKPRLSVFRSNKSIYCQLIDDVAGNTLAAATSLGMTGTPIERAKATGLALAANAQSVGIQAVVFDRGGYLYHGRIKSLADGAREGGLLF
jgi:large subunit ribosomal protein L18